MPTVDLIVKAEDEPNRPSLGLNRGDVQSVVEHPANHGRVHIEDPRYLIVTVRDADLVECRTWASSGLQTVAQAVSGQPGPKRLRVFDVSGLDMWDEMTMSEARARVSERGY